MKRIIIIGSGMGGLSAGIHAQRNGFESIIFEAHSTPGGQCTSWTRKGYVFDGCLHHFGGFAPDMKFFDFWKELGVIPCKKVEVKECVSAVSRDGTYFHDYYDLDQLEAHMKGISPEDTTLIDEYIRRIRVFQKGDLFGTMILGTFREKLKYVPYIIKRAGYFKDTLDTFGARFKHPFLREAFPLLNYSLSNIPLFFYISKHVAGTRGGMDWPVGGSKTIAECMAKRYLELGGVIHTNKKVKKILTENNHAMGVGLEDGSIHQADIVISNADGRKTIQTMLSGQYENKKIRGYCQMKDDHNIPFAVQVYLGVKRDLSDYPSSLLLFLEEPTVISGHSCKHLELQIYGFDKSMAPEGKGVIKIELFSKYSYFKSLSEDKNLYKNEKEKIAHEVIGLLDKQFPGIQEDVEVIDVVTLQTWEKYMGGTQGFDHFPNKKFSFLRTMLGLDRMDMLPGLKNFYFTGGWVTSAGALVLNALSGKTVIHKICKKNGMKFKV